MGVVITGGFTVASGGRGQPCRPVLSFLLREVKVVRKIIEASTVAADVAGVDAGAGAELTSRMVTICTSQSASLSSAPGRVSVVLAYRRAIAGGIPCVTVAR